MPRSKRDKKISLTKTKKKGLASKQKLIEDIRACVDQYERIFLFSIRNMRSGPLKEVRSQWKKSKFFFGKSKVMALALGRSKESEVSKNLHKLAAEIQGQCGLLFTDEEQDKVIEWFDNFVEPEFARSGFIATRTITLKKGLMDEYEWNGSMEPSLRKLGLPVALKLGKINLREDYVVCKEGKVLNPSQAQILKLIGERLAEFRVTINSVWTKGGHFEIFEKLEKESGNKKPTNDEQGNNSEDDGDEEMEEE